MKISVIIPTFKPQAYLWTCLDSICEQNFPKKDYEVILVLNGCYEPWNSAIGEYINNKMENLHIKYIQTNEPGVSNARNIGLDNAIGDYITFIDDDDFVSPDYLKELYINASPNTVSLCYPLSFNDGTQKYFPYRITKDYEKNKNKRYCDYKKARKFFSGPVYKLIHKDIIGGRRFDIKFSNGEDSIFMFLISDSIQNVAFTSKKAIYFRRLRTNSAVSQKRSFINIVNNMQKMIFAYSSIYIKNFRRYDFLFFLSRVIGAINGAIYNIVCIHKRTLPII